VEVPALQDRWAPPEILVLRAAGRDSSDWESGTRISLPQRVFLGGPHPVAPRPLSIFLTGAVSTGAQPRVELRCLTDEPGLARQVGTVRIRRESAVANPPEGKVDGQWAPKRRLLCHKKIMSIVFNRKGIYRHPLGCLQFMLGGMLVS
jgi:hypothetical protein